MKPMRETTRIDNPAIFVAIQYLDPEDTQDAVYLEARGIPPRRAVERESWVTPQRLADALVLVVFIAMLIWSRL